MRVFVLFLLIIVNSLASDWINYFGGRESFLTSQSVLISAKDRVFETPSMLSDLKMSDVQIQGHQCESDILTPVSDGQEHKEYHLFYQVQYHARFFSGVDSICLIPQRHVLRCQNLEGRALQNCLSEFQRCLRTDIQNIVLLSDLYYDQCGNLLRGFVLKNYLSRDEELSTLFSPGHDIIRNHDYGQGVISVELAPKTNVRREVFHFFTTPSEKDFENL